MSAFLWTFLTGFVGLHIGWYWLQQTHVPEEKRHDHPLMKIYKTFTKPKEDND